MTKNKIIINNILCIIAVTVTTVYNYISLELNYLD